MPIIVMPEFEREARLRLAPLTQATNESLQPDVGPSSMPTATPLAALSDLTSGRGIVIRRPDHYVVLHSKGALRLKRLSEGCRGMATGPALLRQLAVSRPDMQWILQADVDEAIASLDAGDVECVATPLGLVGSEASESRMLASRACTHAPLCGVWAIVPGEGADSLAPELQAFDDPRTRIYAAAEAAAVTALAEGAGVPLERAMLAGIDCSIPGAQHVVRGVVAPPVGSDGSVIRIEVVTETDVPPGDAGRQLAEELLAAGAAELLSGDADE